MVKIRAELVEQKRDQLTEDWGKEQVKVAELQATPSPPVQMFRVAWLVRV
jgi:hypothetical protein